MKTIASIAGAQSANRLPRQLFERVNTLSRSRRGSDNPEHGYLGRPLLTLYTVKAP